MLISGFQFRLDGFDCAFHLDQFLHVLERLNGSSTVEGQPPAISQHAGVREERPDSYGKGAEVRDLSCGGGVEAWYEEPRCNQICADIR